MRAFNNRGNRSRSCGYCRAQGHAIKDCPNIEYDFKEWSAYRVPHKSPTLNYARWFAADYSAWIKAVNKYYPKWVAAQERKTSPTPRPQSPRKCGFCGDPSHTRRSCEKLQKFASDLKRANTNYRTALYNHLVKDLGLGIGAAVKVQAPNRSYYSRKNGENENPELIGIVNGFDLDSSNLFSTTFNGAVPWDYRGEIHITVLVNGETRPLELTKKHSEYNGKHLIRVGSAWNGYEFVQAIGPATQPLDEDWAENGLVNEFDWLLKKRSLEWLKNNGIACCVQNWK